MNTFKKKSLYAALASVGALGVVGTAQAANVNPDGLGQVLIYPYYTTNSVGTTTPAAYNSLLSVVNSTASAKAVKVRFIEGKTSAEVLDFNVFLSAKDVWTAAVIPVGDGAGVFTADKSCTLPAIPSTAATAQPFVNFAYAGDGGGDGLDRTKEGYIEIIEMGVVTGTTAVAVTHKSGVPPCTAAELTDAKVTANIVAPTGGLFGGISLINVLAGVDITENAVAIDNFRTTGKYDVPGDIKPDLRDVNPATAVVFAGGAGVVSATGFGQPVDAISALFMVNHVYNEYVLDTVTASKTDWVLTEPTKRYYYDSDGVVAYLFQRNFVTNACDDIGLTVYDREEQTKTTPQGFSPPPPPGKVAGLCWEANVLTFNGGNLLGSINNLSATVEYQNGWADLLISTPAAGKFDGLFAHYLPAAAITKTSPLGGTSTLPGTFFGLPIIGFAAQSFTNGTLTTTSGSLIQANYAGAFNHRFTRDIQ
jgi:hypothetical protein